MLTILIVDDEKLERRGIRFLLEREHGNEEFHILEAANGRAACDLLKRQDVDLLFTDIKMPFMDGLELAAHARELRPQIETVIFSGYGEFEYARQAHAQRCGILCIKTGRSQGICGNAKGGSWKKSGTGNSRNKNSRQARIS